ncbi:MAG: flagellar biosynthetic protein FliO [Gammaproteobacteria bacterium]|nr:flagellar biosynthetic protein FliO [Gammaproteobacteria bacterium]
MNNSLVSAAPLFLMAEAIGAAPGSESARLLESPLSTANLVNTALGLVLVVGLMLALAWLVRRFVQVPGAGKGLVQVLGGVSLGSREKAVLVRVEGHRLLLGVAPGRVQTLLVLDDGQEQTVPFADQLSRVAQAGAARVPGAGDAS